MVGAFAGLNWLPLERGDYRSHLEKIFAGEKLEINRRAFDLGYSAVQKPQMDMP